MNERAILLRYHEIAIKGDNRNWFEQRLIFNIQKLLKRALGDDCSVIVKRVYGRVIVEADWNSMTREALTRVFGLSSFSPMRKVKTDLQEIEKAAVDEFQNFVNAHGMPKNFCVRARRSDKVFQQTSMEIDRIVGSAIKNQFPQLEVDLKNPDFSLGVEIRFHESFLWSEKIPSQGGLPVGTNARLLSLISGGLDSPVSAIHVLKRGSPTSFVHFYGAPFVGEEVLEKIKDLVRAVNHFQPDPQPLHVVEFGKIQERIALVTNPKMRTLLYRRMMIRIANGLAKKISAKALVTGESLGQVASQTVENLATINSVSELPILRPLVTWDKDEIIQRAKRWGTFDISVRPGLDCCTLFADRHPTLRSTESLIEEQESRFPVHEIVKEAVSKIEVIKIKS